MHIQTEAFGLDLIQPCFRYNFVVIRNPIKPWNVFICVALYMVCVLGAYRLDIVSLFETMNNYNAMMEYLL